VYDLLPVTDVRVSEARRWGVDGVGREVEELVDDGRQRQRGEGADLLGGPAESGSPKEVRNVCRCSGQNILLEVIGLIRVSTIPRSELESPRPPGVADPCEAKIFRMQR
jgi:hypothetical protein